MAALREGKPSKLGEFEATADANFFLTNNFSMGNVNTKTFLLILATKRPESFVSGQPINLAETLKAANRSEFHHMMPKDFLKKSGQVDYGENILANLCFLARADNRKLGGQAPSLYRSLMPKHDATVAEILRTAVSTDLLFADAYKPFVEQRATDLATIAKSLCEI
jgi:hypothetical protein